MIHNCPSKPWTWVLVAQVGRSSHLSTPLFSLANRSTNSGVNSVKCACRGHTPYTSLISVRDGPSICTRAICSRSSFATKKQTERIPNLRYPSTACLPACAPQDDNNWDRLLRLGSISYPSLRALRLSAPCHQNRVLRSNCLRTSMRQYALKLYGLSWTSLRHPSFCAICPYKSLMQTVDGKLIDRVLSRPDPVDVLFNLLDHRDDQHQQHVTEISSFA